MAGITLADAQAKLALWLAAEEALATSQSYTIDTGNGSRSLTRANLQEVADRVSYWDAKVKALTPGSRRRVRYVVPQ